MNQAELFKIHMEYDPEKRQDHYYTIREHPTKEMLIEGILNDSTEDEVTDRVQEVSAIMMLMNIVEEVKYYIIWKNATTQHFFDKFAYIVTSNMGEPISNFKEVMIHHYESPPTITMTKL